MDKYLYLPRYEDGKIRDSSELIDRIQLDGFYWKSHTQLEEILLEKIDENMYDKFIIGEFYGVNIQRPLDISLCLKGYFVIFNRIFRGFIQFPIF